MSIGQGFNNSTAHDWIKNPRKPAEFPHCSNLIVPLALEDLGRYNLIWSTITLHYYKNAAFPASHVLNGFAWIALFPSKNKTKLNNKNPRYCSYHSIFSATENDFLALVNKTSAWCAQIQSLAQLLTKEARYLLPLSPTTLNPTESCKMPSREQTYHQKVRNT